MLRIISVYVALLLIVITFILYKSNTVCEHAHWQSFQMMQIEPQFEFEGNIVFDNGDSGFIKHLSESQVRIPTGTAIGVRLLDSSTGEYIFCK
jgi:hypothetical protein